VRFISESVNIDQSMKKAIVLIITAASIIIACSKSKDTTSNNENGNTLDCSTVSAKMYMTDVSPIIQSKCATDGNCHGSGSVNGPGALTTYSAIFNARSNIRAAVASGEMPLTGSLTTAQKNSILCWIDSGAPNN
jgi:hypothetical protein